MPISLPRDLEELRARAIGVGAALVILDPLLSRLDAALNTHKDADVRRALEPLAALADAAGVVVVGLIHVNKSQSSDVLSTLMASRAFVAVARTVLYVMTDPDDEKVQLLGLAKNNLGRMDLPTLAFRIEGVVVAETPEGVVETARVDWIGETERSILDAAAAATAVGTGSDRTAVREAADWLRDFLASHNGSCDSATIKREGRKVGHSQDSLKRARKPLGIISESRGFPRKTYWALPQSEHNRYLHPTALTAPTAPTVIQ